MGAILKKKRKLALYLVLLTLILLIPFRGESEEPFRLKTVVIDAGHGGKDPGALGRKSREKDIVLNIALKLGSYIEKNFPDLKVIYTRKTDEFIELDRRAQIAIENKADLFISVHANSNRNPGAYGAETYVMGLHTNEKNLEVAMKENAVISYEDDYTTKYEGYNPDSPESFIIFNFIQNTYLEQSLQFATHVQDQFRDHARRIDRGVKQAGFIVLWKTTMPSVLVETGYISNAEEEAYLMSATGQDHLASAIFRAFREYKQVLESRSDLAMTQVKPRETTSLYFKVQITASNRKIPLDDPVFKGLDQVEEFVVNGTYKYAAGNEKKYEDIVNYSKTLKTKFPDAFVIAVQNGSLIPLADALKSTGN